MKEIRQHLRVDANLLIGSIEQQVMVNGGDLPAIDTQTATISGTYSPEMTLSLPINTRASFTGTSAANILGTMPGMQNDSSGWSLRHNLPAIGTDGDRKKGRAPVESSFLVVRCCAR